ncbi:hypothetical protein [Salarchaeum sp. JOR-1]|uniref:hypothetical protein n=1 Tax=Salarchaeum sp. JOR-1 TaxID=2599399 RepID=UPI0011985A8E|nr:hypothetical protein [Salarchaeum sp. JOR-1]QDX40661.1 hypothetical protein FQU85_06990 [Salarchaeum sp. JOR-1]
MYSAVADIPLTVESVSLERVARETPEFERVTTVVTLRGDSETGRGEDVTYETAHHDDLTAFAEHEGCDDPERSLDLAGEYTVDSFSAALDDATLWPAGPPERGDFVDYRRWGFEAAALDLALRQAGETLADRLDRTYDPVEFVVSSRLPEGDTSRVDTLLERYPDAEFKLDPTSEWPDATFDALAATDAVRVLDLKGQYDGTDVDQEPDPDLYERVFAFPDAVVEDPAMADATADLVREHGVRVSWDAPIHGLDDVRSLPFQPRWLNVKPSRFGTLESLFETVAWALERDVTLYGGGQFELRVGRGQIQELASLLYPDGPNDVAPAVYNDPDLPDDPPRSPIRVPEDHAGFGF